MLRKLNTELFCWLFILAALAIVNPSHTHFTLCVFNLTGLEWCPGCGIGHSISYLLHGNLQQSWQSHYLGLPALLIILHRCINLSISQFKNQTSS
jgi:hypothetical protein